MSWAAGVLRASGRVGAAGVYAFCLALTLGPLQAACIPLRGGWPFTRVRVARSTARLDVLGPEPGDCGLVDPGLGPGAKSWGRRRMGARGAEGRKSRGFRAKAEITLPVVGLIFGGGRPFSFLHSLSTPLHCTHLPPPRLGLPPGCWAAGQKLSSCFAGHCRSLCVCSASLPAGAQEFSICPPSLQTNSRSIGSGFAALPFFLKMATVKRDF